jgi:large subunit ribosomal protein L2
MPVKKYKPVTPGQRGMTGHTFEEITKSQPERSLLVPLRRQGGRNVHGRQPKFARAMHSRYPAFLLVR